MSEPARLWLLLAQRRGDNNQVLALGEALGLPFETRTMTYRPLARLILKLFPEDVRHLTPSARRWLKPPWPDLVIGIGLRTVPVARWIRKQSGGRTKLVRLGHPRARNELFDLVVTTPQYPVPPGENVLALPLALNRFRDPPEPTPDERIWLEARPRPHLLLSLGGPSAMWRLDLAALKEATRKLARRAQKKKGTLIVVGSPRTPPEAWAVVKDTGADNDRVAIVGFEVRYPVLLADADEQFVTADSVSMISEAVMTGKPVGMIPVEPDRRGRWNIRGRKADRTPFRDPRRFWAEVERLGLVGSVDKPKRGRWIDPVEMAVDAMRERLGGLLE